MIYWDLQCGVCGCKHLCHAMPWHGRDRADVQRCFFREGRADLYIYIQVFIIQVPNFFFVKKFPFFHLLTPYFFFQKIPSDLYRIP